jgi:hypothetical protein
MGKTAKQLNRAKSTVCEQIKLHNANINESGFCLECHKANNPIEKELLVRKGRGSLNDSC